MDDPNLMLFLMFLFVLPYGKALIITVLLSIAKIPILVKAVLL